MLNLYVLFLMVWLLKQQSRLPGEIRKSKTGKAVLGMMQVQRVPEGWAVVRPASLGVPRQGGLRCAWPTLGSRGRVGSLSVRWGSGPFRQMTCTWEGEMEMSLHPNLQPCVWNFECSILKWRCLQKWKAGWLLQRDVLSRPPHALLCVLTLLGLFVMKFCLYFFHAICSLFYLVVLLLSQV